MRIHYLILAGALGAPGVVAAQTPEARDIAAAAFLTPSTVIGGMRPMIAASVTSADKRAIGTFGVARGTASGGEMNYWLRASGPLDEDDSKKPVVLGDLNAYRKAVKLEAGFGGLSWDWNDQPTRQFALCRSVYSRRPSTKFADSVFKARLGKKDENQDSVRAVTIDFLTQKHCSAHELDAKDAATFLRLVNFGPVLLWGLSGEIARQDYKFADTVKLKFDKHTQRPKAATAGLGVYLPDQRLLIAVSGKVQSGFEEGVPRQYCIPTGTAPGQQCRAVPLAAPDSKNQTLLGVEARWFANSSVGVSPRFTAELTGDRAFAFDLPILLRQPTDAGFTSAFILGWRSKPSSPDMDDRTYIALEIGYTYGIGLRM